MTRLVTLSPSVPASGLSLTMNDMVTVGGSIGCACSGSVDRRIAERVGDGALGQAGDGDDVAGLGLVDRLALEAAEGEDLRDAAGLDELAVTGEDLDWPGWASACRSRCGR